MAALTALALGAGLASMGVGLFESSEGRSRQEQGLKEQQYGYQIQQQAAQEQAQISKNQAAASVLYAGQERGIEIAAAGLSQSTALQSQAINRAIFDQQRNIQGYQQTAMEMDARRANLEQIRNSQRARAISLATGVAQGGSGYVGGSSARGGAYGGIAGQTNTNLVANNQALQTGEQIYAANTAISNSNLQMNDLQTAYALAQAGFQTQKSDLIYNYAQTNAGFQTQLADTQTKMAQGQYYVNLGGGEAQAGQSQIQFGQSLFQAGPSIFSAGQSIGQLTQGLPSFTSLLNFASTPGVTGNGVFGIGGARPTGTIF